MDDMIGINPRSTVCKASVLYLVHRCFVVVAVVFVVLCYNHKLIDSTRTSQLPLFYILVCLLYFLLSSSLGLCPHFKFSSDFLVLLLHAVYILCGWEGCSRLLLNSLLGSVWPVEPWSFYILSASMTSALQLLSTVGQFPIKSESLGWDMCTLKSLRNSILQPSMSLSCVLSWALASDISIGILVLSVSLEMVLALQKSWQYWLEHLLAASSSAVALMMSDNLWALPKDITPCILLPNH